MRQSASLIHAGHPSVCSELFCFVGFFQYTLKGRVGFIWGLVLDSFSGVLPDTRWSRELDAQMCLKWHGLFKRVPFYIKYRKKVHELSETETIQVSQELSHKLNNLLLIPDRLNIWASKSTWQVQKEKNDEGNKRNFTANKEWKLEIVSSHTPPCSPHYP